MNLCYDNCKCETTSSASYLKPVVKIQEYADNESVKYTISKIIAKTKKLEVLMNDTYLVSNSTRYDAKSELADNSSVEVHRSFKYIPHLENKTKITHKMLISKNRNALITIGISTVKRPEETYLKQMLTSLFNSMNEDERSCVLVVVLIGEVF